MIYSRPYQYDCSLTIMSFQVRLQTRGPGDPSGMLRTMVHIVKNHGVLALYSGVRLTLPPSIPQEP